MGQWNDEGAGLTYPPIPRIGLASVLSDWAGRGSLFDALSIPSDQRDERRWTPLDVRRRANRVLLGQLDPLIQRWPKRTTQWLDHLPATRSHARVVETMPFSGVSWAESRRRFGWPPSAFSGKYAERSADMLSVQILRWSISRLKAVWLDVSRAQPDITFGCDGQLQAALALLDFEPILSSTEGAPARSDLVALRREGAPWGGVAEVAHRLLLAESSLEHLLFELLLPDDELRWRIFHLAILGLILQALRSCGCAVTSLRPLSAQSSGPNYEVRRADGKIYQLWFEASSVWAFHSVVSPFVEATRGMKSAARSNGADLLLLDSNKQALIVECKYSANPDRVARDGYYQAVAYAAEARSRLVEQVVAVAVGPESTVPEASFVALNVGTVGTIAPSHLLELVERFVDHT